MEDIILVTGTHRTRSCTNIAFLGGQEDAQVSFQAKVDRRDDIVTINWQFSRERDRGAVLNCGRDGEDLPEDQCIFIRGFRVTRKLRIFPLRLKGEAGPNPDPEGHDDSEESDMVLKPIPSIPESTFWISKYRDPLHTILEYISEEAPPDCDVLLVHDDDLAQFDGIYPLNALEPDVVLSYVRSLKATIHNTRIGAHPKDLPSARHSASAGTESAWVATLSNIFEKQYPSSTSSASQSLHVNTTSIRHIPKGGGGIPVRDLNNYLQGHPTGNLTLHLSWVMRQEGPSHMVTYYVIAKLRGVEIGHGRGPSMAMAKSEAALQALQHLKNFGI
ncbi:hypothetical protein EDB83DRAFT_2654975 [Lactarius deliciosus]|nr:hypothetical protein EDB83DRAFT_2654975 [Lactarius deliciosus]